MRVRLNHAFFACIVALAGCDWGASHGRPRILLFDPQPPGVVDVQMLARALERGTGAEIDVRRVGLLSQSSIAQACDNALVQKPALIVAPAADLVFGLRERTHAIPILFLTLSDPIDSSLVTDTQRPRGNVSGYSFHVDIEAKQLEMLKRTFPSVRRIGVLGDRYAFSTSAFREMARAASDSLDLELVRTHFQTEEQLRAAFARTLEAGVDAWLVPQGGTSYRFAAQVVELVRASGLPAMYGHERFVELGGLMSYSQAFEDPSERIVRMANSVLQGFPVGELPVERPQNFRFAVGTAAWRAARPRPAQKMLLLATHFHNPADAP
jgi:ABC-type uncharacterized transport system substrate-binding protein